MLQTSLLYLSRSASSNPTSLANPDQPLRYSVPFALVRTLSLNSRTRLSCARAPVLLVIARSPPAQFAELDHPVVSASTHRSLPICLRHLTGWRLYCTASRR